MMLSKQYRQLPEFFTRITVFCRQYLNDLPTRFSCVSCDISLVQLRHWLVCFAAVSGLNLMRIFTGLVRALSRSSCSCPASLRPQAPGLFARSSRPEATVACCDGLLLITCFGDHCLINGKSTYSPRACCLCCQHRGGFHYAAFQKIQGRF